MNPKGGYFDRKAERYPECLATRRLLLRSKIDELARATYAQNNHVKVLTGSPYYGLRIGDWRVVYEVHNDTLIILNIGPGGDVDR